MICKLAAVVGGQACLNARYRPRLSAGRIAPHIRSPSISLVASASPSQPWIWSKIRCADTLLMAWLGSLRMISVIRRSFRSAISVHLLSG
jgi:hypothetical protein